MADDERDEAFPTPDDDFLNAEGNEIERHIERLETAPWRAPHGALTKLVAWTILVVFGLTILAALALIIAALFGWIELTPPRV